MALSGIQTNQQNLLLFSIIFHQVCLELGNEYSLKDDIDKIEIPTSVVMVNTSTAKDSLHDDVILISIENLSINHSQSYCTDY